MARKYWNPNPILSYNRIFNWVIGYRGAGKTYGAKKHAIKRFKKTGEQFIYLRRYKSDLKKIKFFFSTISKDFPDDTFEVKGWELWINKKLAGYAVPLSSFNNEKSSEYPSVNLIIYDEFLSEKVGAGGMMNDEPDIFLNFVDTVVRDRTELRVLSLANSVSVVNAYFVYFKLYCENVDRFYSNESHVVEITPAGYNELDEEELTPFEKAIRGTKYEKFSRGNEFKNDNYGFVQKRTKQSKFKFSIVTNNIVYGVWVDVEQGLMFVSKKHDPKTRYRYVFQAKDMQENTMLMDTWRKNYLLMKFVSAFKRGYMRFEDLQTRNDMYDLLGKMNIK